MQGDCASPEKCEEVILIWSPKHTIHLIHYHDHWRASPMHDVIFNVRRELIEISNLSSPYIVWRGSQFQPFVDDIGKIAYQRFQITKVMFIDKLKVKNYHGVLVQTGVRYCPGQ
jgi:hypothetical protein